VTDPVRAAPPRRGRGWAIVLLVVLVLLPRVLALAADPPGDLEPNWIFDEGWWAHNARNLVLFGRWIRDQHNPALFLTPLYSATLALIYRVGGVGLTETRLLSGVAGFLTCLVLYLALRRRRSTGRALAPALALGLSYPMLVMNRVGLTESFQLLFIVGTVAAALEALTRPRWAIGAGLAFGAAMLSKPSALVIGMVVAAFWWLEARRGPEPAPARRALGLLARFGAGAAVMLLVYLVLVAVPHWEALRGQLTATVANGFQIEAGPLGAAYIGLGGFGLPVNWFFRRAIVPLVVAMLFLSARLTGAAGERRDPIETFCWLWVGIGLLMSAGLHFIPSRRFFFLLPPLVLLATDAVLTGGLRWPNAVGRPPRPSGLALGGLVLGLTAAFYAQPHVAPRLGRVLTRLGLGAIAPIAPLAAFGSVALLVAAVLVLSWRRPPRRSLVLPAWIPVLAFLINDPGRFAGYAAHPTFSVRDAGREIATLANDWPPDAQVMIGDAAATFALETRLLPISLWRAGENLDAWERFPSASLLSTWVPSDPGLRQATERGLILCRDLNVWPNRAGRPRIRFQLFVKPDLCPTPAAPRSAPASPTSPAAPGGTVRRRPPDSTPPDPDRRLHSP
jgi:4-amino-4-deoxy-L-arabinose transferase-like glycosyltransferase